MNSAQQYYPTTGTAEKATTTDPSLSGNKGQLMRAYISCNILCLTAYIRPLSQSATVQFRYGTMPLGSLILDISFIFTRPN